MPRHARIDAPGAVHHLMVRGIGRTAIFHDTVDRDRFIDRAGSALSDARAPCYAFALLSNHVPFDLQSYNCIAYETITELEEKLGARLKATLGELKPVLHVSGFL